MQVEVAGRVVLREGLLELFACSPHTREHESIVAVEARPWHVFQALGLLGLEPGRPVSYDQGSSGWLPAAGHPVVIEVRYAIDGREQTVSVWDWMKDARTDAPLTPREWVFCGSRVFPGEVFGADVEGTVVCVVDFDTALMGLPELHSADNSLLWVAARTGRIPAEGTACTLLIRAGDREAICVTCGDRGRFRLEGRWLDLPGLAGVLRSRLAADPDLNVRVRLLPGADTAVGRQAVAAIRDLGVRHVRMTGASPEPTSQPTPSSASSAAPG
jgi:hypothetical protein